MLADRKQKHARPYIGNTGSVYPDKAAAFCNHPKEQKLLMFSTWVGVTLLTPLSVRMTLAKFKRM